MTNNARFPSDVRINAILVSYLTLTSDSLIHLFPTNLTTAIHFTVLSVQCNSLDVFV